MAPPLSSAAPGPACCSGPGGVLLAPGGGPEGSKSREPDLSDFRLLPLKALPARVAQLSLPDGAPIIALPTFGPSLKLGWLSLCFGVAVTASNVLNCFYICWAFSRIPGQDNDVPANFLQRARIYLEFVMLAAIPLWMLGMELLTSCNPSSERHHDAATNATLRIGRWCSVPIALLDMLSINALTLLVLAYPPTMLRQMRLIRVQMDETVPQRRRRRAVATSAVFALLLGSAAVGVLALVLKLSQIVFIGSTHFSDFTAGQWLALVAFVNSMVALSNQEAALLQHTRTVLYAPYLSRCTNAPLNVDAYLCGLLVQHYSWRGFLWYIVLTPEKLALLLIDPSRNTIPAGTREMTSLESAAAAAARLGKWRDVGDVEKGQPLTPPVRGESHMPETPTRTAEHSQI